MKKTQFWWYLTGKLDMLFNENASASEILKNLSWENHVYIYIYLLYLQHLQLDCNLFFSTFLVAYKKPLTVGYLHCRPSTNYLRPSEPWIEGSHEQCWDVAGRSSKTFVTLHSWLETNSKVLNTISIYCIYNIYIYMWAFSVTSHDECNNNIKHVSLLWKIHRIYLWLTAKFHTFRFLSHSSQGCSSFFRMFTEHLESPPKIDGRKFRLTFFQADFSLQIWSRPISIG